MSARATLRPLVVLCMSALAGIAASDCQAARIEAVAGKAYPLTKAHGPWMVMVASFHTTAADGQTDEGKTPDQAAADLVLELRQKGVPAYTYAVDPNSPMMRTSAVFSTQDRLGQTVKRKNLRQVRSLCVIAGNYPSFDDATAQNTLKWLKAYEPACLKNGVSYRATPGRPKPLSGAFLTINPLLSPEEVAAKNPDKLLRKLNSGVKHSLTDNTGEYTLLVAHFGGKSFTEVQQQKELMDFLKDNDLDDAAQQANDLAVALRQNLDLRGRFNNIDAYVWHDRVSSIVTVGSFSSPNDPAITRYRQMFAAAFDPDINRVGPQYISIGSAASPRTWAFVPTPQVIRVPQVR